MWEGSFLAQLGEAETCAVSGDGCGGGASGRGGRRTSDIVFFKYFHVFSTVAREREVSGPPPRA